MEQGGETVKTLTAALAAAFVSKNQVPIGEVPGLIASIYSSLNGLGGAAPAQAEEVAKPAVSIKKSVTPEYIICLEDGKKLKMLKRHLRTAYNLSPEDYRARWGLPLDYPMVAPNYAAQRSAFAKEIGLGTGGRKKAAPPPPTPTKAAGRGAGKKA